METDNKKIKLYIINGFLGAGKTTMVQNLFHIWPQKRISVVVNEFGTTGLDGMVLRTKGIEMVEINNGSVFCSCRSDQFLEAMRALAEKQPEIVIVESSGLSNPSGMGKIIEVLQSLTNNAFHYGGSITLVDAIGFDDVVDTSVIARQQVVCSDLLIINKIDLVDAQALAALKARLYALNPFAGVLTTTYAKIDAAAFDELSPERTLEDVGWTGGSVVGTQKLLLELAGDFREEQLMRWLFAISPYLYRIKGFVTVEGRLRYINSTRRSVVIEETTLIPEEHVVVVLAPGHLPLKKQMAEQWNLIFRSDYKLSLL